MSVETAPPVNSSRGIERAYNATSEELLETVEGIWNVTDSDDARRNIELQRQLAPVFLEGIDEGHVDLGGRSIDLQASHVADLHEKRELLLAEFMEDPAKSFVSEFHMLEQVFAGRVLRGEINGIQTADWCTQDHENQRADHNFRRLVMSDGSELLSIEKTYDVGGQTLPVTVMFADNTLRVMTKKWARGHYVDVELNADRAHDVLSELFVGIVRASAVQFERTPDEITTHNQQARRYTIKQLSSQRDV